MIAPRDMSLEMDRGTQILDLPWGDFPTLIGLGHTCRHLPRKLVPEVRRMYQRWVTIVVENPQDELAQKKLAVCLLILLNTWKDEPKGERDTRIRHQCAEMMDDRWASFTVQNFRGRSEGKQRTTQNGEERVEAMAKLDTMGEDKLQTTEGKALVEKVMGPKREMVAKHFANGEGGKAFMAATSRAVSAKKGVETFNFIKGMHKKQSGTEQERILDILKEVAALPAQDTRMRMMTKEELQKIVRKSKNGIAVGIDGISAEVYKQLLTETAGLHHGEQDELAEGLCTLLHTMMVMGTHMRLHDYLRSGEGIAIMQQSTDAMGNKKQKLRQLSKGTVLMKLSDTHVKNLNRGAMGELCKGVQYAGQSRGGEKKFHVTKVGGDMEPRQSYVGIDSAAAFPNINKSAVLKGSMLLNTETVAYSARRLAMVNAVTVYHGCEDGVKTIPQEHGAQAGATLSPDDYTLAQSPILQKMNDTARAVHGGYAAGYVDDVNARSSHIQLVRVLNIIQEEGPELGMHINISKTVYLLQETTDRVEDDERRDELISMGIPTEQIVTHPNTQDGDNQDREGDRDGRFGHIVNGVPWGSKEFVTKFINEKVAEWKKNCTDIRRLQDPQQEYTMIVGSMDPQCIHLLRQLNPSDGWIVAKAYAGLQKEALEGLVGVEMTEYEMTKARMKRQDGGLGLLDAEALVDPAYVASFTGSLDAIGDTYPEVLEDLRRKAAGEKFVSKSEAVEQYCSAIVRIQVDSPHVNIPYLLDLVEKNGKALDKLQRRLMKVKQMRLQRKVEEIIKRNPIEQAVWQSSCGPQASAWLTVMPTGETKMGIAEFPNQVRNRLYLKHPYIQEGVKCLCTRLSSVDRQGIHLQKCNICNSQKIRTHDTLAVTWTSCARTAGMVAHHEPTRLLEGGQRVDVHTFDAGGIQVALDIRATNAVGAGLEQGLVKGSPVMGEMALKSEREKKGKFKKKCKDKGMEFIPLVMETQGLWGEEAKAWFKLLMTKIARGCDVPYSTLTTYWTQRFSVALQTMVAKAQMCTAARIHAIRHLDYLEDPEGEVMHDHAAWQASGYIVD